MEGQVFGRRFRVDGPLGSSRAQVFAATDLHTGEVVALKVLTFAALRSDLDVDRFLREARNLARVSHPAVVRFVDAGEDDGTPWVAMELVRGESLKDRTERDGALSPEAALRVAEDALDALAALHDAALVHRDIKPEHLLFTEDDAFKLIDLGLAKAEATLDLTKTGGLVGTLRYLSPEQATNAKHIGPPSDLFSLALVLFEALTGELPEGNVGGPELLARRATEPPPRSIRSLRQDLDPRLETLLERCLAFDPQERPQSAREAAELLRLPHVDAPLPPLPISSSPDPTVGSTKVASTHRRGGAKPVAPGPTARDTAQRLTRSPRSSPPLRALVIGMATILVPACLVLLGLTVLSATEAPTVTQRLGHGPWEIVDIVRAGDGSGGLFSLAIDRNSYEAVLFKIDLATGDLHPFVGPLAGTGLGGGLLVSYGEVIFVVFSDRALSVSLAEREVLWEKGFTGQEGAHSACAGSEEELCVFWPPVPGQGTLGVKLTENDRPRRTSFRRAECATNLRMRFDGMLGVTSDWPRSGGGLQYGRNRLEEDGLSLTLVGLAPISLPSPAVAWLGQSTVAWSSFRHTHVAREQPDGNWVRSEKFRDLRANPGWLRAHGDQLWLVDMDGFHLRRFDVSTGEELPVRFLDP